MKKLVLFFLTLITSLVTAQTQFLEQELMPRIGYDLEVRDFTTVDIDFDGDLDIISASCDKAADPEGLVRLFINMDSKYFIPIHIDSLTGASRVNFGDLDSDGDLDIIAGSYSESVLIWYENDGDLNFTKDTLFTNKIDPTCLEIQDIDNDGDFDIIANNYSQGRISWYENDGNQSFTEHGVDTAAIQESTIVIDLDLDSDLDIVSYSRAKREITFYENDSNAVFTKSIIEDSLMDTREVSIADLDSDGDLDILSTSRFTKLVTWYENDGNQNFTLHDSLISGLTELRTVRANDLDGDGDFDLLVHTVDTLFLFENDGNENFVQSFFDPGNFYLSYYGNTGYKTGLHGEIVDIENDGDMDIITINNLTNDIEFYKNQGNQNYDRLLVSGEKVEVEDLKALDFDFDGDLDIISAAIKGIYWDEYIEDGFYSTHRLFSSAQSKFVENVDLDGDGDLDIITASYDSGHEWFENVNNEYFNQNYLDSGNSAFSNICVMDFDLDSDLDLVVGNFNATVYRNDGNLSFTDTVISNYNLRQLLIIDFDMDGDEDIVFQGSSFSSIRWLRNDGNLTFSSVVLIDEEIPIMNDFEIYDFDSDGDLDIVGVSYYEDEVSWLKNDGTENFSRHLIASNVKNSEDIDLLDFDNDGDMDFATIGRYSGALRIYEYEEDTTFTHYTLDTLPDFNSSVGTGDVDNDGDIDLVMYDGTSMKRNLWYENLQVNNYLHLKLVPFIDLNQNSLKDTNEIAFVEGSLVVSPDEVYQTWTNEWVELFLTTGEDYSLVLNIDTSIWEATDSLNRIIEVDSIQAIDTSLFIGLNPLHDLYIKSDITAAWPRCGDTIPHIVQVQNCGGHLDSAFVYYSLDEAAQFVSSIPEALSIDESGVTFKLNDFEIGESRELKIQVALPIPIDTLYHTLNVEVDTGAIVLASTANYDEIIRCSYDPNDKTVFPQYLEEGYILDNQDLEYLIRFQNTGNDTAFLVVIKDTLDIALNMNSFELINASHPVSIVRSSELNSLEFRFNDIILTDTLTNEEQSHGFVKYRISAVDSLIVGSSITNTAHIYFDQNDPIITNTTSNEVYDCAYLGSDIETSSNVFYTAWPDVEIDLNEDFIQSAEWKIGDSIVSTNTTSFNPTFYGAGNQYVTIHLENELCQLDTSILITVVDNIGLSENDFGEILHIYPNPTNGKFNVDMGQSYEFLEVKISDIFGKVVQNMNFQGVQNFELRINQECGMYILEIGNGEGVKAFMKIIKSN